jgi:hypothetical protein
LLNNKLYYTTMKRLINLLKKKEKLIFTYGFIILALILFSILFIRTITLIITVCMFLFINMMLKFYKRVFPELPLELEVTIFGSVVTTMAFGIWAGFFVAFFSSFLSEFMNQRISPNYFINMLIYLLVPLMSLFLTENSLVTGGIIIMIITNIIIYLIFQLYLHYDIFKNTAYSITNIAWNYFLFTYVAVPVFKIISIG